MKLKFEIVYRPRVYHQAVDGMPQPHKVDWERSGNVEVVDKDISTYCILGQKSNALCATKKDRARSLTIPTSKTISENQQTSAYCRKIGKNVGNNAQFTVNKKGL